MVALELLDEARSRAEICELLTDFRVGLSETHDDAVTSVIDLVTGWGDPKLRAATGLADRGRAE